MYLHIEVQAWRSPDTEHNDILLYLYMAQRACCIHVPQLELAAFNVCLAALELLMVCFPSLALQRSSLHCRCLLPNNPAQRTQSA